LLEIFKLKPNQIVGSLSTGQQKKIQIVAGLASNPKLIIVDEITAVLDPESRFLFFTKLEELVKSKKASVILATNIAEDLIKNATNIYFLNENKISKHEPSEILGLFKIRKTA
jgi:ABC-type multidrug transport system ATPase subunit